MNNTGFSFVELDKRLQAIPDGPASVLNSPRWIIVLDVVGALGLVLGLAPILLIQVFEPKSWMVWMARSGLWIAWLAFAPGFVRKVWVVAHSMLCWRAEQVEQLDHDLAQFRELRRWLVQFPAELVSEHLHFVRQGHDRLSTKLRFLGGSLESLGILPLLVALGIQLKAFNQWDQIPYWQVLLALLLAITYLITFVGSLMRIRLQLYDMVLADSLAARGILDQTQSV